MTTGRRYVLVEGYGEVEAVGNLLTRMSRQLEDHVPWSKPLRWPNLHQWNSPRTGGVRKGAEFIRAKGDAAGLLVVRDEDDGCPRELGPALAAELRALGLPFPTAYVLLKPEFEVLFLPCVELMAGRALDARPGLRPDTRWDGAHWESRRGVKEWLSNHFAGGRAYKPSIDQLPMTRMIDLDVLARAGVPCFGTLDRALRYLARPEAGPGDVYPLVDNEP